MCVYVCVCILYVYICYVYDKVQGKQTKYLVLCVLPIIHGFRCTCLSNPVGMKTLRKDQISKRLKALWERLSGNDCSFL